jgi:excisionase family DNA binding protein
MLKTHLRNERAACTEGFPIGPFGHQQNLVAGEAGDSTDLVEEFLDLGKILDTIDAVTNRDAIPRLCTLNAWPREAWPKHIHGDIEKASILEWTQSVANLANAGALEVDDEVRAESRRLLDLKPTQDVMPSSVLGSEPQPDPMAAPAPEPIQAAEGPDMLTVDEAADYLRCTRSVVMSAMRRGQLPAAKVGNGWRITKANLDTYLRGAHGDPVV